MKLFTNHRNLQMFDITISRGENSGRQKDLLKNELKREARAAMASTLFCIV